MNGIRSRLAGIADAIAAAMLAAMFGAFILQIFSRYVLADPFGWTLELCLTLWVWCVFWGNAFVVRHRDHVIFDVAYNAAGAKARRAMAFVGAAAIVIGFAASLAPTWDYIDFLKIKKSATLKISMRAVFSIYALFIVAVAAAYAYRCYCIIRRGVPEDAPEGSPPS